MTRAHIIVLNYNGRELLRECLPSVVEAARTCPFPCRVSVIDNDSTDDSVSWLAETWPDLTLWQEPNRGLASFNNVLNRIEEPCVLLLNNDVKLDPNSVAPLAKALEEHPDALFTAPQCWTFDGKIYEGMRTRVRSRFGIVQGLCRIPGHEATIDRPGLTAAAGPILAVHRARFLELGGFDAIYFPGRIEDLDLGFRGWMAGWRGYYVPESLAFHKGLGSFEPAFGKAGCDRLAARNTLIFSWKNLGGRRLLEHLAWIPIRLLRSVTSGDLTFSKAITEAVPKLNYVIEERRRMEVGAGDWIPRQEAFFSEFGW